MEGVLLLCAVLAGCMGVAMVNREASAAISVRNAIHKCKWTQKKWSLLYTHQADIV